jgi:hypothetical protein
MEEISDQIKKRIAEELGWRERMILELRLGIGVEKLHTLGEIGEQLNLTRERVRQLQNKALAQIGEPALNALLLTSEINRLNEPTRARWRKKLVKRVEEKYGHLKQDQVLNVTVWLSRDAVSTQTGTSSKTHAFPATWARIDGSRTIFLDDEGEIYADWPTEIVDSIKWPNEKKIKASRESHNERMAKIKEKYPRAWNAWSEQEDSTLTNEFRERIDFDLMCAIHERAPGGINSRLKKLDLIPKTQNASKTRRLLRSSE